VEQESRREYLVNIPIRDKINKDLGYRAGPYSEQVINPKNLKEMVMDVYSHPSKHTEIIRVTLKSYGTK
jgi:hypothetical protein